MTAPTNPAVTPRPSPTLGDVVLRALRLHWKPALLIAAAITLLAWLAAAAQPKRYRAESIGAVTPKFTNLQPSDVMRGVDTLDRRLVVSTIAELAQTPRTQRQVGMRDGENVVAGVIPSTSLFRLTVESTDARHAAAIANALPPLLDAQTRAMFAVYDVSLVSAATVPSKPSLPRVSRAVMAGLVIGLLVGVAVAYLIEQRHLWLAR